MTSFSHYKFRVRVKKFDDFDKFLHEMQSIHNGIRNAITAEINNAIIRLESVPPNSTIREEYVKCGKSNCNKCSENYHYSYHGHGPYFFAYFRDKENHARLKKKYIGEIDPRNPYFREFFRKFKKLMVLVGEA